jgi:hypothetical protein
MKALKDSPLPKPCEFGHYWLGARPNGGAVIFRASPYGNKENNGKFFASRGVMGGVLFDADGEIRWFGTAEEAHKALLGAGYEEGAHKS